MAGWTISDLHYDVVSLLKQLNPNLPLFMYSHSMGGLVLSTFLTNNPNLNVSGVIFSAPLVEFAPNQGIDNSKRVLIKVLAPHIDVCCSADLIRNLS